jgi:hypothetical protein
MPELMATKMDEKVQKGLNFKFLLPESRFPFDKSLSEAPKNVQIRTLSELPAVVGVTDKFAAICFLQIGGSCKRKHPFPENVNGVNIQY